MAKTRTLPDKYYDKDYETNGIHRVPLWRIAGFALNNTATNLYLMFMNYVSFYLLGFVGVGMVMASSFTMAMRIWDGVTDPFIGYMVDKTNGKFGKTARSWSLATSFWRLPALSCSTLPTNCRKALPALFSLLCSAAFITWAIPASALLPRAHRAA